MPDCVAGGDCLMWWVVFALGGVIVVTPGMVNPLAPINGATLLGIGLLVWSVLKLVKEGEDNE